MERFNDVLPNESISSPSRRAPDAMPRTDGVRKAVDAMNDAMRAAGLRLEIGSVVNWTQANLAVAALRKLGTNATGTQLRDYFNSISAYRASWAC